MTKYFHSETKDYAAHNSRVIGLCYQFVSSEPSGSNFGWFASWRDRSDPAAHGKHYA